MQKIETTPKKLSLAKKRIAELSNLDYSFSAAGGITEKCTTTDPASPPDTSRGLEAMVLGI
jgi:hypothetical protein